MSTETDANETTARLRCEYCGRFKGDSHDCAGMPADADSAEPDSNSDDSMSTSPTTDPDADVESLPGTRSPVTADADREVAEVECPHCGFTDTDETVVRWHITKSTDSRHGGDDPQTTIHGFSATTNVILRDADGTELDVVSGSPAQLAHASGLEGELTTDLIPNDVGEDTATKYIVKTAILNPTDSVADLHRKVNAKLQDDGKATVSYAQVRNRLESFTDTQKRPDGRHQNSGGSPGTVKESFADLSPVQKEIANQFARYHDDDSVTQQEMAEEAGGFHSTNITTFKSDDDLMAITEARTEAYKAGDIDLAPPGAYYADDVPTPDAQADSGTSDGRVGDTPRATQDTIDDADAGRDASDDAERTSQHDDDAWRDAYEQAREVVASHRRVAKREVETTNAESAGRVAATLEEIEAHLDDIDAVIRDR